MFGLTFEKLLLIGIIAVFLLGPDRLPHYAAQLARLVRRLRDMANGAKDRMRDEMGPEFDDLDWKKLDPRQYDPRRIIREALLEDPADSEGKGQSESGPATISRGDSAPDWAAARRQRAADRNLAATPPAPFDSEST
jgi:sec-independent protein translocase protein TatB